MRKTLLLASIAVLALAPLRASAAEPAEVVTGYADIAAAVYGESLTSAQALSAAVDALVANPSDETLKAARDAWRAARRPYQQTEVYRFGNAIVDEWEGKVNAWPLDEGLIDYVDAGYGTENPENAFYTANVIANLQEAGEIEANVATGYHAIEFLLWGQDLNGTGPGAGNRPATDFDTANCTNGNCDRRAAYLKAATELLVSDLQEMADAWKVGGEARKELADKGEAGGLATILTGMGSLSYGELAGERTKLGLMLHDPEEEHDCFSDNTHMSHLDDIIGIRNVWVGTYDGFDGKPVKVASLKDLVEAKDPALAAEVTAKLDATVAAAEKMRARAETVEAYDQMIGEGNEAGNAAVQAVVDALIDQTRSIERVVASLGLEEVAFEGSDSLDNPGAVFQ
jgi:putative iron-regulated protein